jgi:DNA-binding transcriptional LysR family regulator
MPRSVNLRQIEAFKAVIEAGTVSKAAELLRVTQPAVSKLLAHLELDSGLELFDRRHGRLAPSEHGLRLYEEVSRIFSGVHQVERAVDSIRREKAGRLSIGLMPALTGSFAARVTTAFLARRPDVYLSLATRSSRNLMEMVARRHIDIALISVTAHSLPITTESLLPGAMACMLPRRHRLAVHAVLTPQMLAEENFISFDAETQTQERINAAFAAQGAKPNVVMEASTATMVGEFVAAGLGVSIIHPLLAEPFRDRVLLRRFEPRTEFDFAICRAPESRRSELAEDFVQAVRAEAVRFQRMLDEVLPPMPAGRGRR